MIKFILFSVIVGWIICSPTLLLFRVLHAETPPIKPWFKKAVLLKSYQQSFDWLTPWDKREIRTQSGMALVVNLPLSKKSETSKKADKKTLYLLTTAEMVADATLIEVTRKDIRQPFQAKLVLMDYAANLALLNIENSKFWDGLNPIKWSPVKNKSKVDAIDVYSFKIKSAHKWEIESGTIQLMTVGHRRVSDAWFPILKLNGFSKARQGYPLLQENEAVGMILETDKRKAIPTQMLLEFLEHAGKATYNSLAHRGFSWRELPQPSTADYFKIPPALPGIWISRVLPYGTGSEVLKHGDYLTKIGKWRLSHDAIIEHPEWGHSLFDLLFLDQLKVGDPLELDIIRDGEAMILHTKVSAYKDDGRTVPLKRVGYTPRYLIQGGFLFQELTANYLSMWGANWRSRAPVRLRLFLEKNKTVLMGNNLNDESELQSAKSAQRFVLVTQVIPDQINIGYQKLSNAIVQQINGQEIRRLKDVEEAFLNPDTGFHRIDFLPGSDRLSAVLPVEGLNQSNQRIKSNFRIPKLQSY